MQDEIFGFFISLLRGGLLLNSNFFSLKKLQETKVCKFTHAFKMELVLEMFMLANLVSTKRPFLDLLV
jgi:hypothetical protein